MNFGVFCPSTHQDFEGLIENNWSNCFLFESILKEYPRIAMFKKIAKKNKIFFFGFYNDVFEKEPQGIVDVGESASIARSHFKENWKQALVRYKELLTKDCGFYEAFQGFYIDEPFLCGITGQDFLTVTRELAELFPDKKIFSCFSVGGVASDVWTVDGCDELTPETAKYLTDIAFDMYHPFDRETYSHITNEMKAKMGNRKDYRVWHVPCIMNYRGDKSEQHCLDHLHGLYDLLMSEQPENRGGLMCYAWWVSKSETEQLGNLGFSDLQGRKQGDANWSNLKSEIERIGREFVSSSLVESNI